VGRLGALENIVAVAVGVYTFGTGRGGIAVAVWSVGVMGR